MRAATTAIAVALFSFGCSSDDSSSAKDASVHDAMNVAEVEDGSGSPAADAATGFNGQPCWQYVFCAQDGNGGPWNCDCGGP
jgi:hypothetical protein